MVKSKKKWYNPKLRSLPGHATIPTLKLNFSPVRGSILMRFKSLEPPEFILLAIEFSLKSVAKCKFCEFEIVIICMPLIYGQSMPYMYDGASVNGRKKNLFFSQLFFQKEFPPFSKNRRIFFLNILSPLFVQTDYLSSFSTFKGALIIWI